MIVLGFQFAFSLSLLLLGLTVVIPAGSQRVSPERKDSD